MKPKNKPQEIGYFIPEQKPTTTPTPEQGNNSGHTPGDWVNDGSLIIGGVNKETYDGNGGLVICEMNPITEYDTPTPEAFIANCRLVASAPELKTENEKLRELNSRLLELEKCFYMDICRAYNAGRQNQINIVLAKGTPDEDKMFLSSHDYFKTEFPEFTTNVP